MENGGTAMMAPAYASTEKGVRRGQEAVVKVSTQEQNEKQCGLFEGPAHGATFLLSTLGQAA